MSGLRRVGHGGQRYGISRGEWTDVSHGCVMVFGEVEV